MSSPKEIKKRRFGFTLFEVLIVFAGAAVLAAVVIVVLNPSEQLRKGRDTRRISDLKTLDRALALMQTENTAFILGNSSTTYVSLPDSTATTTAGTNCATLGLPALPSGYVYACGASSTYRNVDGTGWVPVNFQGASFGSPLSSLPIDPLNTAAGGFYFTYMKGSWELTAHMESVTYAAGGTKDLETKDGGVNNQRLEFGSDLKLTPNIGTGAGSGGGGGSSSTAPTVANVTPSNGSSTGGTSVTITGTNFVSTPSVTFGGSAATGVSFVASTSLTATTPAHAAGTVDVVVVNPDTQSGTCTGCFTYNAGASSSTTTIGDGTNPSNASLNPGGLATMVDSFTFQTSSGTDTLTSISVAITSGTDVGLSLVEVTDASGATVYGSLANPGGSSFTVNLTTSITATTAATTYKLRLTPKSHASMPAPPGASYAVVGTVTDWGGANTKAGTDAGSATVTIDNLSPNDASGFSGTAGDTQVALSWTNSSSSDFSNVVILRNTSAVADVPTEGSSPATGSTIGASTVVYTGSGTSANDTGLTNGTAYYYKIFSKDASGNYSLGVAAGPYTPAAAIAGRYWIAGSGNWSDTLHWSASSGGLPGASVPTASDDVYFDASSFLIPAQTVTVDVAALARNLNWTGAANSPTLAGSASLNVAGSLTFIAGMTNSYTGTITFSSGVSGNTVTLAGKTLGGSAVFNGAGVWTLQDGFNVGANTVTLTAGTLDTNGQTVTCGTFSSSNSNVRTLTLGASAVNCSSAGTAWNFGTATNLTINPSTSVITLSGAGVTFAGGGNTYGTLVISGSGTPAITGSNTFANLTRTGTALLTDGLMIVANQTVTSALTLTGNSQSNRLYVSSDARGTSRTLTAGSVSLTNVDFEDITGAGAASPFTGTSIGNALGNSGITFTAAVTRYWVGNGGNWSDTLHWSTASGGGSGASVPLPQDTALVNALSITSAAQTIVPDLPRMGIINFTGVLNTPSFSFSSAPTTIYGAVTLVVGMTMTGGQPTTFAPRSATNVTSNGRVFWNPFTVDAPGGTMTLVGAATVSSTLTFSQGTVNANNQTFTVNTFASTGTFARTIQMGTGQWTLNGTGNVWNVAATGMTVTLAVPASTSLMYLRSDGTNMAKTFTGAGLSYGTVRFGGAGTGASFTIQGSNTFSVLRLNSTSTKTTNFTAGTTQTVTNSFQANGAAANLISLRSTTPSSAYTINAPASSLSYLDVQDSVAAGGIPFACLNPTCTNSGNNTNWTF